MYKYAICAYIYLSAQCFMQKSAVNEKICENTKKIVDNIQTRVYYASIKTFGEDK